MSRKTNKTNETTDNATGIQLDDSVIITDENTGNEVAPEQVDDAPVDEQAKPEKHDHFSNIVLSGKGKKLSPKTTNHVFFDVAEHDEEGELYIRLSGNEGGGLHSKEWINLTTIIAILDEQVDKPFKSTALKPAFKGASANNAGFLAGVLRSPDIGLIVQSGTSVFLHVLADDYEEKKAKLLALT